MIRPEMAQRFIDQITEYTEYNINIMDGSGVIIASRDKNRIGSYHEAADRIIRGKEDIISVDDDKMFPGVLPGINMAIMEDGKKEGVVGVTGDPAHIREVAMVTRLAIEAMLKYEKQQERVLLRRERKENFIYMLTRVEDADPAELRQLAERLNYDESILRVPILCRILDDTPAEEMFRLIRTNDGHSRQDMSVITDEKHVLVFRTLQEAKGSKYSRFRENILAYLDRTLRELRSRHGTKPAAVFYIGTPQRAFTQYIHAYRHCTWLEANAGISGNSAAEAVFFYDHTEEYFYSVLPKEELHRVFYQYRLQLQAEDREQFLETAGALIRNNFNLTGAAKEMYIHKNTMMYRYNKLKDLLDIDPVRSSSDRNFLVLLYYSMK